MLAADKTPPQTENPYDYLGKKSFSYVLPRIIH